MNRASLYESGWRPRGVKRAWDVCSMDPGSTRRLLGEWALRAGGEIIEAVAWFDPDDNMKVLVADFDSGKRLTVRNLARSRKVSIERLAA